MSKPLLTPGPSTHVLDLFIQSITDIWNPGLYHFELAMLPQVDFVRVWRGERGGGERSVERGGDHSRQVGGTGGRGGGRHLTHHHWGGRRRHGAGNKSEISQLEEAHYQAIYIEYFKVS